MRPPVSFVYFDLDDTLLDHRRAEQRALVDLRRRYGALARAHPDHVASVYHDVNVRIWQRYGAGEIDKEEAKSGRFRELFAAVGEDADPVEAGDAYLEAYSRHWAYVEGARDAFQHIAGRHRVGILTNGFREIQRRKLDRFPLLAKASEAIVISEEFGALKPDPRLFAHATAQAAVPAREILYVGDSLRSDVLGGLAAGWQVAWYTRDPGDAPEEAFTFQDWAQLLRYLSALSATGPDDEAGTRSGS